MANRHSIEKKDDRGLLMKTKIIEKTKELTAFFILAVLAGLMIALGGMSFLYITSFNPNSIWLKIAGAIVFNIGLLFIVLLGLKLFTGMNCDLIKMNYKEWYKLIICFIGNAVGCWLGAVLMFKTPIGGDLMARAIAVSTSKLDCDWWVTLLSSIMCGLLITLALLGYRACEPKSKMAAIFALMLPVFVFVILGVDHSVANQIYFALATLGGKPFTGEIVLNTFIAMIGNIIGGVSIPALLWAKDKLVNNKNGNCDNQNEQ